MTRSLEEPFLFSDLALARRLDRAEAESGARFVEARARLFPDSGAEWIEVAGAYALFDTPASPVTQTFGLGLFQPATHSVLEKIETFFEERGAPVSHDVSPLAGVETLALLSERSYQPIELASVMYRAVRGAPLVGSRNERIQVRLVGDGEHELWAETAARGWSEFPEAADFLPGIGRINAQRENALSYLAELDGKTIGAGALCIGGGVALLAGACTVPEARKQGAQLALLETRLRHAAERGCDIAMMCAAPGSASQRNAERHGFRIAYTRIKWRLASPGRNPSP